MSKQAPGTEKGHVTWQVHAAGHTDELGAAQEDGPCTTGQAPRQGSTRLVAPYSREQPLSLTQCGHKSKKNNVSGTGCGSVAAESDTHTWAWGRIPKLQKATQQSIFLLFRVTGGLKWFSKGEQGQGDRGGEGRAGRAGQECAVDHLHRPFSLKPFSAGKQPRRLTGPTANSGRSTDNPIR